MDKPAILRRALACLMVAATLFVLLSLLSYSRADLTQSPAPRPVANWCGITGAYISHALMTHFGLASYLLVGLTAAWGVLFLIRKKIADLWMKIIGATLLICTASAAAGMITSVPAWGPSWGGSLGYFFGKILRQYVRENGAIIVLSLSTVLGLIFLGIDHYVVRGAVALYKKIIAGLKSVWARRKARPRPETPTEALATASIEPHVAKVNEPAQDTQLKKKAKTAEPEPAPEPTPVDSRKSIEERLSSSIKKATQPLKVPTLADNRGSYDEGYQLPPLDMLDDPEFRDNSEAQKNIENVIAILETTLADFNIGAEVVDIDRGPVVTRYELALAPGIKVTRITSLADDIAMAVKAPTVRIVAPIPGKSTVGVEIPNKLRETVRLKELIGSNAYKQEKFQIPVMLGKDTSGLPVISDLAKMPHLLIAGATGAGKSVCINSILLSILMTKRPDDLQLILVDPKMVELSTYEGVPHLLCPVVTDMKRAPWILEWAVKQMDERYDLLSSVGVRHITSYNTLGEEELKKRVKADVDADALPVHLPYIVIIIDELADLMMSSAKEVESSITRLAQKSRAVGIHILVATQRPSVDVITGLIKANMPARISFQVASKIDSRTILDRNGAEKLLGMGDQLFLPPASSALLRLQGTYVSDQEIKRVVNHTKDSATLIQRTRQYKLDLDNWGMNADADDGPDDELYEDACRVVIESQRGSVSLLQRKLEIGYTRASRLIDYMAQDGIVGSYKGSKAREVLVTLEEWEGRGKQEGYGAASMPDVVE